MKMMVETVTALNALTTPFALAIAPTEVIKGERILTQLGEKFASFGSRPVVIGGDRSLNTVQPSLEKIFEQYQLINKTCTPIQECSETILECLKTEVKTHEGDFLIAVGGGKVLDASKLLAHQCQLPIIAIPTSGATCAAWTALSNIYSDTGAFQYDVALSHCPNLLILDYEIIAQAPKRTLVAGIGDAIAKWYEASISSGHSSATLTIAAVQQARVLRDLLFQKSVNALNNIGGEDWREVVDATVLLAGVIGGLGGANCRTVAAHAVHNGLTHIPLAHHALHGEKVAYGILVQLRLEEMLQGNQLATSTRQQLLQFYEQIGLPQTLEDLGLNHVTLEELRHSADITCLPQSDLHRLPFTVNAEQLIAAMVSTAS
jgi:glycerol dehydrogenase-like iron-containing ADH family enzyme